MFHCRSKIGFRDHYQNAYPDARFSFARSFPGIRSLGLRRQSRVSPYLARLPDARREKAGPDHYRHPWTLRSEPVGLGKRGRPASSFVLCAGFNGPGPRVCSRNLIVYRKGDRLAVDLFVGEGR